MYKYTYQYLLSSGNDLHSNYENTVLTARFSFDKEVSPNQRAEVKKRCRLKDITRSYAIEESPLD